MKFIKKHLKLLIIILAVVLLIIGSVFYFTKKDTKTEINDLEIKYLNGDSINIKNPSSSYEETKEITITNTSKDLKTYSLSWKEVSNTFAEQNKLLYTIKGNGDRAASLGKSQVPAADSKIFNSVAIQAGKTHTYKITITYNGKKVESNSFLGTLKINSEKAKKNNSKDGIPYKEKQKQTEKTKTETKKNSSKKA